MKKHLITACLYTLVTGVLLGIGYPLAITVLAHLLMRGKADGQILTQNGQSVGSALIGQPFTGPNYFHSRPSNAGTGYDASNSAGSNLGPTSKVLADRVKDSVKTEFTGSPVPVDLVTASGSGLDPDITPAAAFYQVHRIAGERHVPDALIDALVQRNITPRQLGLLGEPRVNVLSVNLALDQMKTRP